MNKQKVLEKNAEVTLNGIKARGDPVKGKDKIVTLNSTPVGKFKKRLITAGVSLLAVGNMIGLAVNWAPEMVHVAYPLGGVYMALLLTIYLTKME